MPWKSWCSHVVDPRNDARRPYTELGLRDRVTGLCMEPPRGGTITILQQCDKIFEKGLRPGVGLLNGVVAARRAQR